ncbi:hypothetical protein AAFF_G00222820 [Aldrovandia affinis]|uniref:Uncharacterized protein n=1 Tax=Aldrovandia affinis TaxID=143900 RepID=A0AAD7RFJ9_9TELE|nr:hypothetical protein AAFF_G00222820 [Aldrovandia affinis]
MNGRKMTRAPLKGVSPPHVIEPLLIAVALLFFLPPSFFFSSPGFRPRHSVRALTVALRLCAFRSADQFGGAERSARRYSKGFYSLLSPQFFASRLPFFPLPTHSFPPRFPFWTF